MIIIEKCILDNETCTQNKYVYCLLYTNCIFKQIIYKKDTIIQENLNITYKGE